MTGRITLVGDTQISPREQTIVTRPAQVEDAPSLARLYFASYESNDLWSQEQAQEKIEKIIAGEFGEFYAEASPVVVDDNGQIVAAALTLKNRNDMVGPDNTPTIYELFTASSRRREGLAEQLIAATSEVLNKSGHEEFFVHIDEGNAAALALYLTLDFRRWFPTEEDPF
ncbi:MULTISPECIES: GNAT family N-acetyltransferase [unclassified Rothia (in: high G+C Gram-positive bacteria)]|uniref:GNAT family N-acetyltransferase n=1 Tax=unclassified Rothia (in: high G+C Gram-positive bacteria) TaxID=2689056 RepID=UPI00195E73A7|nr:MULTISPECIES: GNAT family N-acetyltransferase [unclassified Rothia (in: high G+C Gram-positive bacteria)]MBM7050456.1 GNAT family N-acetyltransferase [Rothia sp. ZJ1223]QRZ62437.1 GNAT family N-acetyltransferase [Rothia sp. ZJ932]